MDRPDLWKSAWPNLNQVVVPTLNMNVKDRVVWADGNGNMDDFSVHKVYNTIRPRGVLKEWACVVWIKPRMPKHAFVVWCALHNRLPTQDRLALWKETPPDSGNMVCPLCKCVPDSISHLFFLCPYSKEVWLHVKVMGAVTLPNDWDTIVQDLQRMGLNVLTTRIKLLFAAMVYHIWKERNLRLFQSVARDAKEIVKLLGNEMHMFIAARKCKFQIRCGDYGAQNAT